MKSRLRRSDWLFLAMAALAFVVVLAAGFGLTFYWDDWEYVTSRDGWDLETFMRPHNEHWSAGALLIFKTLLATVGMHSYVPYQVVLVVLHILVAAALFVLVRREAGPYVGLAAAALFLFLGSGGENLLWPAEIGWNLAVAAGAWALVLTIGRGPSRRPWLVAALLLVAVSSSGVGLAFLATVFVVGLIGPARRRQLWAIVPAVVAYAAWFLIYGRNAVSSDGLSTSNLREVPAYVASGVGNAMGRLTGWGDEPGMIAAVALAVATAWRLLGPRPILVGALVGIVGLLVQFVITGIARAGLGTDQAAAAHYVYVAAFFLLLALGSWLSLLRIGAGKLRPLVVLAALTTVALGANLVALAYTRSSFVDAANNTRATITVLTSFGGSPAMPMSRGVYPIPGPSQLNELFAKYGSPLSDGLAPAWTPSPAALDRALFEALEQDLVIKPAVVPAETELPSLDRVAEAVTTEDQGCLVITPTGGQPHVWAHVDGGRPLYLQSSAGGTARLLLSHFGVPLDDAGIDIALPAGGAVVLAIPDLGAGEVWSFRFDPPDSGVSRQCLGTGTNY